MIFRPLLTAALGVLLAAGTVHAQRIAFVDSKYILEKMPDYQAAQKELDRFSDQWQKEVDDRWAQIKRLHDAYNAEAILLTEEMKHSRQDEIDKKEQEARDLQKKHFGVGGDIFKKRQELVQPIQDRIYTAVKEVAGTSYIAIFDIGGQGNNVLYASEKYDKSDAVLRKLGIKPGKEGDNPGNVRGEEDDDKDQEKGTTPTKDTKGTPPPSRDNGGGLKDSKPKQ